MIPASVAVAPRRSSHAAIIGRAAVRALYTELALSPKPGLVSPLDSGAHDDMDMTTFMRSLFALRGYFCAIAAAGAAGADFTDLQALGMRAERRMLEATRGINTHRGAIFSLGLLAGAAGWLGAEGRSITGDALGHCIARRWGAAIVRAGEQASSSHGIEAVRRYGARGAREEAAAGFPLLFDLALPTLVCSLAQGNVEADLVQTLFSFMAELVETNLLHRGGPEGLAFVRAQARAFLETGGVAADGWRDRALALHRACIARRLSPGGAADMLAAAAFVHDLRTGAVAS